MLKDKAASCDMIPSVVLVYRVPTLVTRFPRIDSSKGTTAFGLRDVCYPRDTFLVAPCRSFVNA